MIGEGEILVIDDFVSPEYQEKIKKELMGLDNNFPWHYVEDVTSAGDYDSQYRAALAHQYVEIDDDDDSSEIVSVYHHLFTPMLSKACQYLKMPEAEVLQGRSFLQFPLNLESKEIDTPHIDLDEGDEHIVVLYYVVSADGDTVIYNERTKSDTYTEKQRVTPKQGRVVIFDGGQYHTAEQPKHGVRCIVNYNIDFYGTEL